MRRKYYIFTVVLLLFNLSCTKQGGRQPSSELEVGISTEQNEMGGGAPSTSLMPQARPANLERDFRARQRASLASSPLSERYPPRVAKFSESLSEARSYTNAAWLALSDVEKARHIQKVSLALINAHGLRDVYSPRILTCKVYRESTFNPQIDSRYSSAKGISQVVNGTVDAVFRQISFRFKTPGFQDVRRGETFRARMANSMTAQLELGLAVLEVKRAEARSSNIRTLLKRYYGSRSSKCNNDYAERIYNCASCIKNKGMSQSCLKKAKGNKRGC